MRFRPAGGGSPIRVAVPVKVVPSGRVPIAGVVLKKLVYVRGAKVRGRVRFSKPWRKGRVELRALPLGRGSSRSIGTFRPKRRSRSAPFTLRLPKKVAGAVRVLACGKVGKARGCVVDPDVRFVGTPDAEARAVRATQGGEDPVTDDDPAPQARALAALLCQALPPASRARPVEAVQRGQAASLTDEYAIKAVEWAFVWLHDVTGINGDEDNDDLAFQTIALNEAIFGMIDRALHGAHALCMREPGMRRANVFARACSSLASKYLVDMTDALDSVGAGMPALRGQARGVDDRGRYDREGWRRYDDVDRHVHDAGSTRPTARCGPWTSRPSASGPPERLHASPGETAIRSPS